MKIIDNVHTKLLEKAMDVYSLRQKMTAANIANLDTPGYKKLSVSFEDELNKISDGKLNKSTLEQVNPRIVETDEQPIMEDELMEMADTQIRVQMVTRALRHNFELLRSGITGRSR